MKRKWFVSIGVLLVCGFVLAGCDTGTGGGGGNGGGNGGSGGGSNVWSLLLGTWKSSDNRFCKFENHGSEKAVEIYSLNLNISTVTANTITGIWPGYGGEAFSFNFELSNNNQTLTITNYVQKGVAKSKYNGVFTK
ncbi:MAG: hypothetical protein LBH73_03645 [Spirochaetaceae bacterium]|jgi:hypothetical protein|nr:hypothetical protein [Spirochaetaceae bacterium]